MPRVPLVPTGASSRSRCPETESRVVSPVPIHWVPFDDRSKAVVRRGSHSFTGRMKRLPWAYCVHCGLIALKNDETRRAMRAQCVTMEDG